MFVAGNLIRVLEIYGLSTVDSCMEKVTIYLGRKKAGMSGYIVMPAVEEDVTSSATLGGTAGVYCR